MRKLSTSKENLAEVGTLREIQSEQYGVYYMRCIANLDWFPSEISPEESMLWFEKFHPRHYYGSYMLVLGDATADINKYCSLFVALEEDNKDWFILNKQCKFAEYIRERKLRNKNLPVAASQKQVNNWLTKSTKFVLR